MIMQTADLYLDKLVRLLLSYEPERIILFGSRARQRPPKKQQGIYCPLLRHSCRLPVCRKRLRAESCDGATRL
jgi:hypothetical protein